MTIRWDEVQKAIYPIKSYEDLCQRIKISFSFQFIHETYNMTLPDLGKYTHTLLGGDPRKRYTIYDSRLSSVITRLHKAGVENVVDLKECTARREHLAVLVERSEVPATDIAMLLKYLVYWVIPSEKYLSGLVKSGSDLQEAIQKLRTLEIRTNLELLQLGITSVGRKELADKSKIPNSAINELVNRADFSRLPWASKATISNVIGAGYGSLQQLANANLEQLISDFFRYGKSIGKNLKLGNEIESSYRIAQIIPAVVHSD